MSGPGALDGGVHNLGWPGDLPWLVHAADNLGSPPAGDIPGGRVVDLLEPERDPLVDLVDRIQRRQPQVPREITGQGTGVDPRFVLPVKRPPDLLVEDRRDLVPRRSVPRRPLTIP